MEQFPYLCCCIAVLWLTWKHETERGKKSALTRDYMHPETVGSKLKLIKNYLRSTMSNLRLTNLTILSIEREITDSIDFKSVISAFANQKSRKVSIQININFILRKTDEICKKI